MPTYITGDRMKVSVSSMAGLWDTASGMGAERDNVKLRPGAGADKVVVSTQVEPGDITVTKMFDADTDVALLARLNAEDDFAGTTITVTYLDEDGVPLAGRQTVYSGCVVKSFEAPEADANSSDAAKLSVTFSRSTGD